MSQMARIREQATESEAVVRNITKDIQLLDLAKKNLTTSMTTLKRLQMLGMSMCFRRPPNEVLILPCSKCIKSTRRAREGEEICRDFANFSGV